MDIQRFNDTLIQIGEKARCERGPLLKTAVAQAAFWEGDAQAREAAQMAALGTILMPQYQPGMPDKLNNVIVVGQEFAYLDWRGEHVWHVYELKTEMEANDVTGEPEEITRWHRRGYKATEAEASADAMRIAIGVAA